MIHLFILTIGPVQGFISQARKTKDLYAGSLLLSSLARKAFELLEKKTGKPNIELIFPAFYDKSGKPLSSNPNRFAAIIKSKESDEVQNIGKAVKQELIDQVFIDEAIAKLKTVAGFKIEHESIARKQLGSLLEIYWAAMPFEENNYQHAYSKLESYLGGIKNLREVSPLEEAGRKCNVDGIRNVVFYKPVLDNKGGEKMSPSSLLTDYVKLNKTDSRLTPGEGLSAVSMYKRLTDLEFPSTADIALMHLANDIKSYQEYKDYVSLFRKDDFDGQLLFEENVTKEYLNKQGLGYAIDNAGAINVVEEKYKALVNKSGKFQPSYYAVLVFDGDHMGQWLSGSFLKDASKLKDFQIRLRNLLMEYSQWATGYLIAPKGRAVYSGGDDFLGFVNLHHLFEVLKEMREQFHAKISQPLMKEETQFKIKDGSVFSFSAGVAIAHYKQPLSVALEEARNAEKIAKKTRDSFAISVIRHSGGITRSVQPFGADRKAYTEAMHFISEQIKEKNFSNKFIHNLIKETRNWQKADPREMFDLEVSRLIKRAGNDVSKDVESKMTKNVSVLTQNGGAVLAKDLIENTTSTLRVLDFIQRQTKTGESDE